MVTFSKLISLKSKNKTRKMKKTNFITQLGVLALGLTVTLASCKREGCTDPAATNYKKIANHDDGSCEYTKGTTTGGEVSGIIDYDITTPKTFTKGIYTVKETIDVSAALTIMPGCIFIFESGKGLNIQAEGYVSAIGTAAEPIIFKGSTENSPGYWAGIRIGSNNPSNHLEYVTVQDAGSYWAWEKANIYVDNAARLILKYSTISRSAGNGLYVESDATLSNFTSNSFNNNTLAGVNIGARQVGSLDVASNYNVSNGEAFVNARGGTISTPQTWQALNTPILLSASTDVTAALTLNAGITIWQAAGKGFDVKSSGSFTAVGTAAQPITIQGQYASAGYSAGIRIDSNNPANKLAYVNMSNLGSYWFWNYSSIHINGGRLEIDNCSITNSNSWAIYVESSSTVVTNGVTQTTAAGVLANNTFTGNGAGADADCAGGGCTIYFE